jgi:hypothetical protein
MTRKSTVINFAREIIEGCLPSPSLLIQNKTTPEKFWDIMAAQSGLYGKSHVVLNISELVTFLGKEGYNLGMPILLTDLYDCPIKREGGGSLNYGTLPILNPFVTLIGGSTPSWLVRAINPDVIEGGFTSRVIFISSEHRKKLIFWPEGLQQPNVDMVKEYLCAVRDHAIKLEHIEPDEETKKFLDAWYRSRDYSTEAYLRSFESREDSHILRLAGTLALSQLKSSIGLSEVELALYAISRAKKSGRSIFKSAVSDLKLTNGLDKIRESLLKRGLNGIKNGELWMQCRHYLLVGEYNSLMEILVDMKAVRQYIVPHGSGRPSKYYVATTKLLNPNAWSEIMLRTGMARVPDETLLPEQIVEPPSERSLALVHHTSSETPSHLEKSQSPSLYLDICYTSDDQKN